MVIANDEQRLAQAELHAATTALLATLRWRPMAPISTCLRILGSRSRPPSSNRCALSESSAVLRLDGSLRKFIYPVLEFLR